MSNNYGGENDFPVAAGKGLSIERGLKQLQRPHLRSPLLQCSRGVWGGTRLISKNNRIQKVKQINYKEQRIGHNNNNG